MNGIRREKSLGDLLRPRFKRWPNLDPRTDLLVRTVLQLLMEVEAIREALINLEEGRRGGDSVYGRAYRQKAYLTHNNAGPSTGLDKLVSLFESWEVEKHPGKLEPREWMETPMLRRLGFSEEEVAAYKREALEAEVFS